MDVSDNKDQSRELEMFRALKPYLHLCLTLNHEINNALAGIMGYSEFLILEADTLTDEQVEYSKRILECAERVEQHINAICRAKIELSEKIDIGALEDQLPETDLRSHQLVSLTDNPLER